MAEMTAAVDEHFRWVMTPVGRTLQAPAVDKLAPHLFTSRDVSFRGERADADYARLAASFDLPPAGLVFVSQVHGRALRIVRPGEEASAAEADAIVSTDPDRAVAVRAADCVPILLADSRSRAVAAVHAGWRGSSAGIATAAVEAMARLGIPPSDLVAAIGPSVGPCCYQVDARVRASFLGASPSTRPASLAGLQTVVGSWFQDDGPDHWRLDLWRANADQLESAGVSAAAIHVARYCTAHHRDTCFSYRAEGAGTGRMVAAIRLRETSRSVTVRA
jgi:YfiH family protein